MVFILLHKMLRILRPVWNAIYFVHCMFLRRRPLITFQTGCTPGPIKNSLRPATQSPKDRAITSRDINLINLN